MKEFSKIFIYYRNEGYDKIFIIEMKKYGKIFISSRNEGT